MMNSDDGGHSIVKYGLPGAAFLMFFVWAGTHAAILWETQNGIIRTSLTLLFAVLILIRPKTMKDKLRQPLTPGWLITAAVIGIAFSATGLVFSIRQLEWIGIILLLFACLTAALPAAWRYDILLALLVLYWLNPLPSPIFTMLQAWMQRASVIGSERLLHMFNVRVWGDGLVLRTGVYTFEVPAWCSGMRAATTVFILSVALGILRRMSPPKILLLTIWSLFHALLLNIIRISIMIAFAPHTHSDRGIKFLHDTAGIVVIAGIVVVYLELVYFEYRKRRREYRKNELNQEHFENISEYPPFWKQIVKHRRIITKISLLIFLLLLIAARSTRYHRAMMIADVVKEMRDLGDMENAQRGALVVRRMIPDELDWKFTAIRIKMISGHHQEVVDELRPMRDLPQQYRIPRKILMAYSLMYLGNLDEAAAIVKTLPDKIRKEDPRVAMIMAEMALRGDDSDAVAVNVVTASAWYPNVGRIRNLYPYLHIHRKWNAMVRSDINIPYHDPVQAFSILEAYMQLGQASKVADITLQAISRWPTDMRVLEPLYFMVLKRPNSKWDRLFSQHLLRSIAVCRNPDLLYETMYKCFSIARPDLAWAIYRRISVIFPNHPTLFMSIAKYGHNWFVFRKQHLGIPSSRPTDVINLKPFYILSKYLPGWQSAAKEIPHAGELSVTNTVPVRKVFLKKAIKEFQRIQKTSGGLSLDMQYLYALALEMNARVDLAVEQLDAITAKHPAEKGRVRIMLSEIYERKGNWIKVYETLRTYILSGKNVDSQNNSLTPCELTWPPENRQKNAPSDELHLKPLLRLISAQMELRFRMAALYTARETVRLFPYSAQAVELLAKVELELGQPHNALKILQNPRFNSIPPLDLIEVEALYQTERFMEVSTFCRRAMLPQMRIPSGTVQHASLPPAELSIMWHLVSIPSEKQFNKTAQQLRRNLSTASTALREILQLWLKAFENHCAGSLATPDEWIAAGRDQLEQATALNQLTLLLCRDERYSEARRAARKAVEAMPAEPILWRILISLSNGDTDVVTQARKHCPDSPELWLAQIVVNVHNTENVTNTPAADSQFKAWLHNAVSESITNDMPPSIMTRAGEYLWRKGFQSEAVRLARMASQNAHGLLPAYIFAMRCAIHEQDKKWALQSTADAIKSSLNPMPELYENLVRLKVADGVIDTQPDMVNALRNLRKSDPDNPYWAQMLGYVRFKRGGWEIVDSVFQMQAAINNGATNYTAYLIASEASRLLQNNERAIDILRKGLSKNPVTPALLNNLAYTYATSEGHISDAVAMLPQLRELAINDPRIEDTIAVILIRDGKFEKARMIVSNILGKSATGSAAWFRAKTHLAEIAWRLGKEPEALSIINTLLRNPLNIPDEDVLAANTLLEQIKSGGKAIFGPGFSTPTTIMPNGTATP